MGQSWRAHPTLRRFSCKPILQLKPPPWGNAMPFDLHHSVCPHDCPSTCSLEVERLDDRTIGRVRGAASNNYTAGVICAKVARYAERVHHPDRLLKPLIRTGAKGEGKFAETSWDEALGRVADAFKTKAAEHGSETVWPYYFAGTMGIVQRDGIHRLRNVMRYSRQAANICTDLVHNGWAAGAGGPMGPDPREMAESDLIIMWGGNPVSTQVNIMTHVTKARKSRGAHFVVVDAYRSPTAEAADELVLVQPGTDGAVASAIMHVLFRDGLADRAYMERRHRPHLYPNWLWFLALTQWTEPSACGRLDRGGRRQISSSRWRRLLVQPHCLQVEQGRGRGNRRYRPVDPDTRHVAHRSGFNL